MSLYTKAKALREERQATHQKSVELQNKVKEEGRSFTTEETTQWDAITADVTRMTGEIETVEGEIQAQEDRASQLDAQADSFGQPIGFVPPNAGGEQEEPRANRSDAVTAWVRNGPASLSQDLRAALDTERPDGIPANGAVVNIRAQSVGTDSEGGYLRDDDLASTIIETQLRFGGMRQGAQVVTTSTGGDLTFPTNNDTGNVGALLAENAQASEQDLVFGAVTLGSFAYTSKIVRVSLQMLQDSAFNVDAYLGRKLGERLGRATNAAHTVGTGSSQPNGIVTAASVGATAASATAITFAELLELKHSVDPAYRVNGMFMLNDTTLLAIKQLSIGTADARPLWQPSPIVGEPDTIDGDRYIINQDMVDAATTTKPVLYGDLTGYVIRDSRDITLLRLVERYADYLQVGFIAFSRTDGDLVDTAAVKTYQMA